MKIIFGIITGVVITCVIAAIAAPIEYDKGYEVGYKNGIEYALDSIPLRADTIYLTSTSQIDSLREDLFVANYKLGRIKAYSNIVEKNPTQSKYFRGWVNRVLND